MEKKTPKYTTIIHKVRIELELSCNEYCVADIIFSLSNNPSSKVKSWCYASKKTIGEFMGIHERRIRDIIDRLIKKEIVIKDEETKYLQTTPLWYNSVVLERLKMKNVIADETSAPMTKRPKHQDETSATEADETSDNNNKVYNNKDNITIVGQADKSGKEFNFNDYLKEIRNNTQRHLQIVGLYWEYKNFTFQNKEQAASALKRELRPAKLLVGYSDDDIIATMDWLRDETEFKWTCETIHKFIDEDLSNLETMKKKKQYV